MTEPTDAEIDAVAQEYLLRMFGSRVVFNEAMIDFARAVLARWGTPAPVGVEPVAWAATSEDGVVEALGMNQSRRFDTPLYTALQPVEREPLTDGQKNAMWVAATIELPSPQNCYLRGMADAERAHGIGIKGGQHGAE